MKIENTELKLEAGKIYRTRYNRKVFISCTMNDYDDVYPVTGLIESEWTTANWRINGAYRLSGPCDDDIISEWED